MSTTDKVLRWVVLIGIFAIPVAVPFIVSSSMFFPFITGKNFTFRIATEIIFAAWFLLALRNKAYRPRFSWIAAALSVLMLVLLLADIFAENPHKAFWSNYERMEGFVSLIHLAIYFIVAGSTLIYENLWLNFFRALSLASIAHGIYGLLQLSGKIIINQGGVRVDGTFGNAAYFGGFLMMMIFLALFLMARDRNVWWKVVYGVAAVLNLIILYHTATRGALLGLIGGLLLAAILIALFGKDTSRLRKGAVGIAIGVVVVSALFLSLKDTAFVKNNSTLARLTSVSWNSPDANARKDVWAMAWQGVKERPILGWGQEGFNFVFNKYYNPNMYLREQWFDRTHNIIFDWLIAAGILGLIGYLSLLILAVMYIWGEAPVYLKQKMPEPQEPLNVLEKAVLTSWFAAYFFQNLFVFDNIGSYIVLFSLLAYLHSRQTVPFNKLETMDVVSVNDAARFYAPIMVVVLAVVIWFVNVNSIFASEDLIQALRQQASPSKNMDYFRSAINRNGFGDQEIREQLIQTAANLNVSNSPAITQDVKSSFAALAASEMEKQIKEDPNDARLRVFLGSFYSIINDLPSAVTQMDQALKLSPAKQVIKASLANIYLRQNQPAKAEELMRSAYESAPQFGEVAVGYAVSTIYANDTKAASEIINTLIQKGPLDGRILQTYLDLKKTREAIAVAKLAYDKRGDAESAVTLSAVYLQIGDKSSAINALRAAITKIPAFKAQGEAFIKQIQEGKTQ